MRKKLKLVWSNLLARLKQVIIAFSIVIAMVSCNTVATDGWTPRPITKRQLVLGGEIEYDLSPDSRWNKVDEYLSPDAKRYLQDQDMCIILFYGSGYDGGRCIAYVIKATGTVEAVLKNYINKKSILPYFRKIKYIGDNITAYVDSYYFNDNPFIYSEIPSYVSQVEVASGSVIIIHSAI